MRVLWWLLAVVSVSLISIPLSHRGTLAPLENLSLRIASPLEQGLRNIADPIADLVRGIIDRGDLARENERLRREIERLQGELARRKDAQRRVRQLEQALRLAESRPEDRLLFADVIAYEPSGLKRAVAINRGAKDGLDEGMVVLSQGGSLVGTISRVYDDFAWVRLVTDPNSVINAQVEGEPQGRGVATGDLGKGLVLDLLPTDASLREGALVTTSGLGGNYPRALLIGTVKEVEDRPQAPFQRATVEPAAPLSSLEAVLVLTSFMPARLVEP